MLKFFDSRSGSLMGKSLQGACRSVFPLQKAEAAQWLAAQGQARFFSAAAVMEKGKIGQRYHVFDGKVQDLP